MYHDTSVQDHLPGGRRLRLSHTTKAQHDRCDGGAAARAAMLWGESVPTSGSGRLSRRLRWPGLPGRLAAAALALAAVVSGVAGPAAPSATAAAKAVTLWCPDAIGPFSVQGTKVVGQGGKTFVSYGITVPGLL